MTLTPKYYLSHETPVGVRYAYPRALVEIAKKTRSWPQTEPTFTVTEPAGATIELTKGWLLSDAPLVELRSERPGPNQSDGYIKRAEGAVGGVVSSDLRKAFEAASERPSVEQLAHYAEHDASHACWECLVVEAIYQQHWVAGEPVVTTERLDGWVPLPGGPDPDPGRTWRVADASLLAIYGAHTAHLWPGYLDGLREEVGARLKEHPLTDTFYDFHGNRGGGGHHGFSLTFDIPWETPRTKTQMFAPRGRRKKVPFTEAVWAMRPSVQLDVPFGAPGATKAEAIAGFEDAVTAQVRRFLPFGDAPRACDHCEGTGWVNSDA